jgi:hypothetical protein
MSIACIAAGAAISSCSGNIDSYMSADSCRSAYPGCYGDCSLNVAALSSGTAGAALASVGISACALSGSGRVLIDQVIINRYAVALVSQPAEGRSAHSRAARSFACLAAGAARATRSSRIDAYISAHTSRASDSASN